MLQTMCKNESWEVNTDNRYRLTLGFVDCHVTGKPYREPILPDKRRSRVEDTKCSGFIGVMSMSNEDCNGSDFGGQSRDRWLCPSK